MRRTSSNKNAKENFYNKNSISNSNYGILNSNNSRSPLKMQNPNNYNPIFPKQNNNFQSLRQKNEFERNLPTKLSAINSFHTPSKVLNENGTTSPGLPLISNINGGYNPQNNSNHSRYSSSVSNNSSSNINLNSYNSNNIPNGSYNKMPSPNIQFNSNLSSVNTFNNNSYGYNKSVNAGYNNIISTGSNSNRNPSANKNNSSLSYNVYADSNGNLKAGSSSLYKSNNLINTSNSNINNNNNISNNNNNNTDSSLAHIRPSSRNQSNNGSIPNDSNNSYNIITNNKLSDNNPTKNNSSNYISNRNSNSYTDGENKIQNSYNPNPNYNNNNNNNNKINNNNSLQIKFDISRKLIGFKNLGNTCFMNTSLQCILHCEAFISRFLEFCELKKPARPTPIANSFLILIESYAKASDKAAISPDELKSAIARKHRIYTGYSQQDSQEFIRKFLDEISQELNLVTEKKPYKILNTNNTHENNKRELNSEYDKIFRDRENSIIVDTFYGQSISIFKCSECSFESYSFEKFLDIPLLLEESYSAQQDIGKLLGKYFESENIQWESACDNKLCKKKTVHRKNLRVSSLPDMLILSLQRYNNRLRRKNNCKVYFKEEIDLKEYTDSACLIGGKFTFKFLFDFLIFSFFFNKISYLFIRFFLLINTYLAFIHLCFYFFKSSCLASSS